MRAKNIRVGLCSADSMQLRTIADYLLERGSVGQCVVFRDGTHLLQELENEEMYDGIVLDTIMQDMDALEFLLRFRKLQVQQRPVIIVLTTTELFRRIQRRVPGEVDSFLFKPLHVDILAERIQLFLSDKRSKIQTELYPLLYQWGVQDERVHGQYLTQAVQIMVQTKRQLALRKELLPMVAKSFGVSVSAVDSGLRRMIQCLEEQNTPAYQQFKKDNGMEGVKPTVKRFLYACSRYADATVENKENIYAR